MTFSCACTVGFIAVFVVTGTFAAKVDGTEVGTSGSFDKAAAGGVSFEGTRDSTFRGYKVGVT
jgi:hypothetical protein